MKDKMKWFGIIALVAVIGFSMTACGGGGGGGGGGDEVTYKGTSSDGETYTLTITKADDDARYTAKDGDTYVLIVGSKTSTGWVVTVTKDGILTLRPSLSSAPVFTANISASGLTALNGTITWDNSDPTPAPGTLTAVPSTPSNPGGGGGVSTLSLSGQVYTQKMDFDNNYNMLYVYEKYTGSVASFTSNAGGTGKITNGQMSFSVGAPPANILEPFNISDLDEMREVIGDVYRDARVTPSDAKSASLDFEGVELSKQNMVMNMNANTGAINMTIEMVQYIYADKNCRIQATGGNVSMMGVNLNVPNLDISLKQGWNTLYMKMVYTSSGNSSFSFTAGDSNTCKWTIDDGSGGSDWW